MLEAIRSRLAPLRSRDRFVQFASAGIVGTAVDNLVLVALVELGGVGPVAAKVVAWELAIVTIFAINERWTFSKHGNAGPRALGRRFARSNLVRLGGLIVTVIVLAGLVYGFDVWYLLANLIGIGVGFAVNYTFESLFTWRIHHSDR